MDFQQTQSRRREQRREERERFRLKEAKLAERNKKVDLIEDELKERERKLNLLGEEKSREFALREEELDSREQLEKLEKMKADFTSFQEEKRGEIALREEELEKMRTEFTSFQEEKSRELDSRKQLLDALSEQLVKDAELRNQEVMEREKLGHSLLERMQLAKQNVESLKTSVDEKMMELASKGQLLDSRIEKVSRDGRLMCAELEKREKLGIGLLNKVCSAMECLEELKAMADQRFEEIASKEADLEREVEEQERRIAEKEESLISKEKELEDRHKAREEKSDLLRGHSLNQFTSNCFKELQIEKDLVEKRARDLDVREQRLNHALQELESKEKQMTTDRVKFPTEVFNALIKIEPDESADLKFLLRMDGKTLQMFLNDCEKEFKSMDDEIFKALHLSSDPAKLVLDAMVGFYPPHLREGDVEYNVRRTCINLLGQLIKLFPTIKPHVREEARELATSWMSQLKAAPQNAESQEVLGFSRLLAAYDLASYFNEDDLSSFLVVDKYKEALGLQLAL